MSTPNKDIDLLSYDERLCRKLEIAVGKQCDAAVDIAVKEYTKLLAEKVKGIFETSVKRFYDSYHPKKYHRKKAMFNIAYIKENGDNLILGFDPAQMEGDQEGRPSPGVSGFYQSEHGLYEQTFKKGWHGGASSINPGKVKDFGYGPHPAPGRPYWGTKAFGYWHWGEPAVVAKQSPFDEIVQETDKLPDDDDLQTLERLIQKEFAKIVPPANWWR